MTTEATERMATSEISLTLSYDAEFARKRRKKRDSDEYEDTNDFIVSFLDGSVQEQGFFGERVQLALGGGDVERVKTGRIPLLMGHNRDDIVGMVTSAKRESGRWDATVRFRENDERAQGIAADIDNGSYPRGISAGVRAVEYTERKDERGVYYFISKWRLNELSLASTPVYDVGFNQDSAPAKLADAFTSEGDAEMPDVQSAVADSVSGAATSQPEPQPTVEITMSNQTNPTTPTDVEFANMTATNEALIQEKDALAAKQAATEEILELGAKYGHADLALQAAQAGETPTAFRDRLLSVVVDARPHTRKVEKQDREMQFSIGRAIAAYILPDNRHAQDEAALEFGMMNEREARSFGAGMAIPMDLAFNTNPASRLVGSGNDYAATVSDNIQPAWVEALIARTPILGKTDLMTGLVDNQEMVVLTDDGSPVYGTDVATPAAINPTQNVINLTPKQATAAVSFTLLANHQTRNAVERYFRMHAMNKMAQVLENSLLKGSGAANNPLGIITLSAQHRANVGNVSMGDNTSKPTKANFTAMMKALDDQNIPSDASWAIVSGSNVFHDALDVPIDGGSGRFLIEDIRGEAPSGQREGRLIPYGYPIILSNQLVEADRQRARAIMGRWSDAVVGVWGNMEVVIDRVTNPSQVKVSFIVWHDIQLRRQQSFVRLSTTN